MFFTQIEFVLFGLVLLTGLALAKKNSTYKIVLLIASILFYGYWDIRFLAILFACIAVNYCCGLLISRSPHRKRYLLCAVFFDTALLALFKYYNFFAANLTAFLSHWDIWIGMLQWILPLGISFFTFQSISYVVDVDQRKTEPCRSLLDFSLFILYLPKLMVGPIARAADFFP